MNRLVIIGNGFDLAHGLKTSYNDFINWYWKERILGFCNEDSNVSEDKLCRLRILRGDNIEKTWEVFAYEYSFFRDYSDEDLLRIKQKIVQDEKQFDISKSALFERITKNIESKGWTDIERDYYELLMEYMRNGWNCKELNDQLDFIKEKLAEYLKTQKADNKIEGVADILNSDFNSNNEIALSSKEIINSDFNRYKEFYHNSVVPSYIMLLDFNYTSTTQMYVNLYVGPGNKVINHIHGTLYNPQQIVFGYGDEMDKDFRQLEERNENELLKNSKSVKYLETSNYRKLLQFIEGDLFQVFIIGHSCGNSDRTLLNTIFEHKNCISIKPFYYIDENGKDNYSELTMNIYRNFNDKRLFRDRVVNKEFCTTIEGKEIER